MGSKGRTGENIGHRTPLAISVVLRSRQSNQRMTPAFLLLVTVLATWLDFVRPSQPNPNPNPPPTIQGGCQQRRVRKNVNSLSSTEVINLQNAMTRALESSVPWRRYQDVAHFHWSPNTGPDALCRPGRGCCPHDSLQFLPWHRLLMANMEELLGEPLPYWDWTLDRDVPRIFENITVLLKNTTSEGSQCQGTDRGSHRRGANINIPSSTLYQEVLTAFSADTFATFSCFIELPHNRLHVEMKCDMGTIEAAAYDPIFYLHHANVDRQFAFWQELQRIENRDIQQSELNDTLRPFDNETYNSFEKTRNNKLGVDTLDYRNNLCYEYDTLTFDGMTPQQFSFDTAREISNNLTLKNARTRFRHFVGVILPKLGPSSSVQLSVCSHSGGCQPAGSVTACGLGPRARKGPNKVVNSSNYYLAEEEVTHLSVRDWDSVYARVTGNNSVSPVDPIIIRRRIQDHLRGGTVFYAPGSNRRMYGDLLKTFKDSV